MAALGLALLELEADDDAMEEDELQEEEDQLNMHMHISMAAAAAAAAAADDPASLHQLLCRSPVRTPSMTAPSHCHAVLCRDAAVRCHLPLSDGAACHACRSVRTERAQRDPQRDPSGMDGCA